MSSFDLVIYVLKFFVPSFFSMLFRAYGLGYSSKKRLIIGLTAYTSYMALVPGILITVMGYGQFTHIAGIVMTFSGVFVLVFSTDPPGKTIFLHLVQGAMVTAMSVIINMIRHVCHLDYTSLVLMLLVSSALLYLVALRIWAKPLRFLADNIHSHLLPLTGIPLINMMLIYLLPIFPSQNFSNYPIYCTMMMLAVEGGFFLTLYSFYHNLLKIKLLLEAEAKSELLAAEILSYQDALTSAKQARHDLRHHNALLANYLECGDVDGAKAYLSQYDKHITDAALKQYCKNPVVNATLRLYARRAENSGVSFNCNADVPEQLLLTAPETGHLFGNLLENACEACEKVLNGGFIRLTAITDKGSLRMELRNSVARTTVFNATGMPLTSKPGGGIGTQSATDIVRHYGGMLNFSQEGNVFVTRLILPLG